MTKKEDTTTTIYQVINSVSGVTWRTFRDSAKAAGYASTLNARFSTQDFEVKVGR